VQDIVPADLLASTANFKRAEISTPHYEKWISLHVKLEKMQEYRASRVAGSKAKDYQYVSNTWHLNHLFLSISRLRGSTTSQIPG
jgi:hypothetical protein